MDCTWKLLMDDKAGDNKRRVIFKGDKGHLVDITLQSNVISEIVPQVLASSWPYRDLTKFLNSKAF